MNAKKNEYRILKQNLPPGKKATSTAREQVMHTNHNRVAM